MSWEDIIKVSESEVALTIKQLIEAATSLKLAVKAGINMVYQERLDNLFRAFEDVVDDMDKLM
jgi:hypothetical protein